MQTSLAKKHDRSKMVLTIAFTVICIVYVLPIVIVLINSFKTNAAVNTDTFALPNEDTFVGWQNYIKGMTFGNYPFIKAVFYSLFITLVSSALILICTSMAAWYVARVGSLFSKIVYYLCVFSMVVPFQMVMFTLSRTAEQVKLPYFSFTSMAFAKIGLNTPWTIPIVYLGFGAGLAVFMFSGFVKTIPLEIEEAAAIDATGKAAKEATDALAAFDEINKLSTTTSVGGGGGASAIAPDFDFDEGPMMEKLDKVFQKINDIFKTIRAGLEIVVDDLKWSFDKKAIPKSKATWLTVLTALLGATLGAAFGGITGGVIGLSLGVLLGLYLVGLDPETWKTEMDAEDAWIVVITALLGALLGSVFLGITGGVAGFSLGAILGLYLTGFAEGDEEHGGKSQLLSELIVVLCALLGAVIGSIVTPGVGTVVGMGLGLILGLSIYSVRKDPKKGTQRLVSIGRSVLLGLLAGVLGVGLAALGIVSAGTAFIISAAIGLALKFFVDSVDDSKVRKATSGFTGTRVSTKAPTRSRRVAAQSLDGNAPVYNEIPALASGAVIPPNRKFLAVLGDQKSGTNVEAPLSTIKQAVMEAMAQGSREPINVNLVVDGKTLARVVVPNINNMTRAAGKPVLLY